MEPLTRKHVEPFVSPRTLLVLHARDNLHFRGEVIQFIFDEKGHLIEVELATFVEITPPEGNVPPSEWPEKEDTRRVNYRTTLEGREVLPSRNGNKSPTLQFRTAFGETVELFRIE